MEQNYVTIPSVEWSSKIFNSLRALRFKAIDFFFVLASKLHDLLKGRYARQRQHTVAYSRHQSYQKESFMKRGVVVSLFLVVSILSWLTLLTLVVLFSLHQTSELAIEQRKEQIATSTPQGASPQAQTISLSLSRLEAQIEVVRNHQLGVLSYLAAQKLSGKEKKARLQESLAYREKADALESVLKRTEKDYSLAMQSFRNQLATAQSLSDLRIER